MALPMKKTAMKAAAMKKQAAMKKAGAKSMKKVMKAKRVSTIAKGKMARAAVFSGRKAKTVGGMTQATLTKNKNGRIVSKKASARAKRAYASSGIKAWADAVKAARKALGITGFVAVGGKSAAGKALYAKAKSLLS
mmetsp:Transcript_17986/g.47934  ORF Transcript_17986/g.47934 Transcript_17986/m.47934 type:complete len:136 (-) Transcript_17986:122-529(-)